MKKIINIVDAKKIFLRFKKERKNLVLCHGVFDMLHPGHIIHLEKAKSLGDILIVSITADKFVNKGPGRPVFSEIERARVLSALKVVDFVLINNAATPIKLLPIIKPNFYCKGSDYKNHKKDITGEIKNEIKAIKKIGGKIFYTDGQTFSSSNLVNNFSDHISSYQKKILNSINKLYNFEQIKKKFTEFNKVKVLIIGEAIIDEYVFCDALGKSGKEPVLALREMKSEKYLGGSLAIAQNISNFCNKVKVLTMIGQKNNYLNYVKNKLNKNISIELINKKNSPTIVKKRFIDYISHNKVLGVYDINDDPLTNSDEKKFIKIILKNIKKYDLVIVSDYGHGLISKKASELISKNSKFLAVNAQINSSNIGYHSMRKYKNIDCLVINEKEIRHEFRNRSADLKILVKMLASEQKIKNLVVTSGKKGATFYNLKDKSFLFSDALAKKIVDKIGAGDSMLGLIALSLKSGLSKSLSLLIGSLAAAFSIESIANREAITKIKILKSIEHLLK